MTITNDIDFERLLLGSNSLPENWNFAYGIRDHRRKALLKNSGHSDSFFKPSSETAMTTFMLGMLEGWEQAHLVSSKEPANTPRNVDGKWSPAFFRRIADQSTPSSSYRTNALVKFLAERLRLNQDAIVDSYLLFEVRTFNHAFNGGETIRNPSFLTVEKEWSRFDALVILPVAKTLVFIESKVESDGKHSACGYNIPQPIRNLETAFFLTTLPESQYEGWDFRYLLLCPRNDEKYCHSFFSKCYAADLDDYEEQLSNSLVSKTFANRKKFKEPWNTLRKNLGAHLAIVYWSEMMAELYRVGFNHHKYFRNLASIEKHGTTPVEATKNRWSISGISPIFAENGGN